MAGNPSRRRDHAHGIRRRSYLLLIVGGALGLLVVGAALSPVAVGSPGPGGSEAKQVRPYRVLRYQGVVAQTSWYTCGPATLATLLTRYYDDPSSEAEMLELSVKAMQGSGKDPTEGITMLALKRALEAKGVPSRGFRVTLEALEDYFREGGLPLVLHVTRPQLHYVLGVGMVGSQLLLADPSFGVRLLPLPALVMDKGFEGFVLVPIPDGARLAAAIKRQREALRGAAVHLAQLMGVREQLP